MTSIFLSHSSKDKTFARRLAKDLRRKGISVWFDEVEMLPGDSLIWKLEHAIKSAAYLGVILSPNSVESEWVRKEVEIATVEEIKERRLKVIPIMHMECEVPGFLSGKVWAEFSKPRSYEKGLRSLLRRLTTDLMKAHTPDWHQHPVVAKNDSWEWTPRAVRLGAKFGLLEAKEGTVQFTPRYVECFCEEARKLLSESWQDFVQDGFVRFHIAAAGTAKTVEAYEDDFAYFLSEASGLPFASYVLTVGHLCRVLRCDNDGAFIPTQEFTDEFFEIAGRELEEERIRADEEADYLVVQALQELVNARLILWAPRQQNHSHLLALILFSLYEFRSIVKKSLAELSKGIIESP